MVRIVLLWTPPQLAATSGVVSPACQLIFDVIGDLITHGRQLKHLVFKDRIVVCSASWLEKRLIHDTNSPRYANRSPCPRFPC
jgi:hypothetical protein